MAAKIGYQISESQLEAIRDKIGSILATELAAQTYTSSLTVWRDRGVKFNTDELPSINLQFDSSTVENQTPDTSQFQAKFFVDVYTNAKHTATTDGDKEATKTALRIAMIIRYILESAEYRRLDLTAGKINNRRVTNIQQAKMSEGDSLHTVVCRIEFLVTFTDSVTNVAGVTGEVVGTQVKIGESEKGFYFLYDNS